MGLSLNPFTGFGLFDGGISDTLDSVTGKTGADAAIQAGQLQSDAIIKSAELGNASSMRIEDLLRGQLGLTRQDFSPFLQAGETALPGLQQSATPEGLDQLLQQIMGTGTFGSLLDQRTRGVEGQLAAGGLTRSGTGVSEAANINSDLAMQLAQMITNNQTNLANTGLNAAAQSGQMTGNINQSLVNSITGNASNQMNAITGAANATAAGILGGAQSQAAGMQNLMNTGMMAYALSDPRLKENVKTIGKIGPLDLIEWDWIPEAKGTFVDKCQNIGFMSTQVKELYPEHVGEFGGYDVVFYGDLMEDLKHAI